MLFVTTVVTSQAGVVSVAVPCPARKSETGISITFSKPSTFGSWAFFLRPAIKVPVHASCSVDTH